MSTVKIRYLNWVVVLRPTTDLADNQGTEDLLAAFKSAWSASYQGIVVNLSDVQTMDATGVGTLMNCVGLANRTHSKIAFCCPSTALARLMARMLAQMQLPRSSGPRIWFESEAEAIRYCSER